MQVKLNIVVAAAVALCAGAVHAEDIVVKIGQVGPVSGSQAHYGKDEQNGARMAIDDLNKQNFMIGGKHAKFELQAEDDAADPKQGTAAATKLCDQKVNGVVGHLNSGTTIPAAKIYFACGIPQISPSATNPGYTQLGYKTAFRVLANDNALGAGLALYAADALKLKRVAIIDDRSAYGQGVAEVFKKSAMARGIEIVSEQYTTDKATDFMAVLTAIKSKSPDGIFYGGMDPQAGPMLRQIETLGMANIKFFGGDGICTEKLIELAAGAKTLNNVVCASGGASIEKMPGGIEWKKRYDAAYPGEYQIYSPFAYDAVMVLADSMKRAGSADPKVYLPFVSKVNYKGVTTTVQFDADGELKNPAMTFYAFKDGKKIALN
ncbi:MAG: branched-chain amino acid ABC transporter substrate-binding protein [Caulobacter sp.]|nr:branched-chain amino acid ABC transporter substrate-binding protein [Vitreoscilla sp.]